MDQRPISAPAGAGIIVVFMKRLALVLLLLLSQAAPAQETARQSAPVVIANRTIIVLRGPIAGYSAEERVRGAIERIEGALDADAYANVAFEESEVGTRVLVGDKLAFMVTRIDIDANAGETTALVAKETGKRLERAIVERREQHSLGYLATAAGFAAGATAVYGALLWLLVLGSRRLGGYVSLAADEKGRASSVAGPVAVTSTLAVPLRTDVPR